MPAEHASRDAGLIPRGVILDPGVTVHTPQMLWLSTGMRAVRHCVETLCSPQASFQADGAALNALRLQAGALPACSADPGDRDVRTLRRDRRARDARSLHPWQPAPDHAARAVREILELVA